MNPSISSRLAQLSERLLEVNQLLSTEEATKNMDNFRKLNRERAELEPVVELYHAYQSCRSDIEAAREMAGASIRLAPDLWEAAGEQQETRRATDPWEPLLEPLQNQRLR